MQKIESSVGGVQRVLKNLLNLDSSFPGPGTTPSEKWDERDQSRESETDIDIEIPIHMYSPGSFDQDSWPSDHDAAGELYGTILDMNGNTTIKHIGGSTGWDSVIDVVRDSIPLGSRLEFLSLGPYVLELGRRVRAENELSSRKGWRGAVIELLRARSLELRVVEISAPTMSEYLRSSASSSHTVLFPPATLPSELRTILTTLN